MVLPGASSTDMGAMCRLKSALAAANRGDEPASSATPPASNRKSRRCISASSPACISQLYLLIEGEGNPHAVLFIQCRPIHEALRVRGQHGPEARYRSRSSEIGGVP